MKLSSLLVKDIIHWNARCALKPQDIEVDEIQDNPPPPSPHATLEVYCLSVKLSRLLVDNIQDSLHISQVTWSKSVVYNETIKVACLS